MDFQVRNILVGFDNSKSANVALKKAADMARRFDAKLHAVYVAKSSNGSGDDIAKAVDDVGKSSGLDIEYLERKGKVYTEIISLERELGADVVIMGTHGEEGWQPFWVGSNAFRIASSANCPVITIQETTNEDKALNDILLPLDDEDTTRQKVPYAVMMAQAYNATVHVYSVTKGTSNAVKARLRAYGKQTQTFLHERGIKTTYGEQFGGDVVKNIMNYGKEVRAGLVMIMADTESKGLIMGSYSQDIVNNSTIPVMVMHGRDLQITGSVGY